MLWVTSKLVTKKILCSAIGDKISAGGHSYILKGMGVEVAVNDISLSYSEEESTRRSYGAAANAAAGASPFTRTEVSLNLRS